MEQHNSYEIHVPYLVLRCLRTFILQIRLFCMQPEAKIYYITRDIERAVGMTPGPNYHIISNKTPYGESIKQQYPDFVTLLNSPDGRSLGTGALMEHPETVTIVPSGSSVLVFKNTARIEPIVAAKGWKMINPKATLSETVENKISQVEWLGELGKKYLPTHNIIVARRLTWTGEPFVLQWAHGHTGGGTILVRSEAELKSLQQKFPERMTRRTTYIQGPSFTINAIVAADKILVGNISYQITGLAPFTDNAFSTVGNDWAVPNTLLNTDEIEYIETMVSDIGKKLNISGWRGLYGVDVIKDDKRDTIHLIEINARQPASTSFESFLQNENRVKGDDGFTTFETHLKAMLGEKIDKPLIPVNDGAQIIQRITRLKRDVNHKIKNSLELSGYQAVIYQNTEYNTDLIRIQSLKNITEGNGKLNENGRKIVSIISD